MPAISIIVPAYNVEKYINRCVDSILAQTFKDFELIFVDDGSPDNCGAICDEYAARDNRIKVIHQKNAGVSVARNNGVKEANGKYITFIDSDDWVSSKCLERMYFACEENNAQMAICDIAMVDTESVETPIPVNERITTGEDALKKYGILMDSRFRGPYAKLVKREIVLEHPFPAGRTYGEDSACVYLWMWDAKKVADIEEKHYYYLQRTESAVHTAYGWHRLGVFDTYNEMLVFYRSIGMEKLLDRTLCIYLDDMIVGYEICIADHKMDIAQRLQQMIHQVLREWCGYSESGIIEHREKMVHILSKMNADTVREVYIVLCANRMATHIQHHTQIPGLQKRLRRFLLRYHPKVNQCPFAYESAFPRLMNLYWIVVAQVRKRRRE